MQQCTGSEVVEYLGKSVIAVYGDLKAIACYPKKINEACEKSLLFLKGKSSEIEILFEKYDDFILIASQNSAIDTINVKKGCVIIVDNPRLCFIRVLDQFFQPKINWGVHPTAVIHPDAIIAENVFIGPYAVIEACTIGKNTVIHSHVKLYSNTRIGENVTIHSGTVIGSDGFGYERLENNTLLKFQHLGGVRIENDVEIGSNTTIDRGTLSDTIIGKGCKIDNQVHIAHNVELGENCVVIAQTMISGSVVIGKNTWVSPSVCVLNGLKIGEKVTLGIGAVVMKNVEDNATVFGVPARKLPNLMNE